MRRVLLLMIIILLLFVPATFTSEIEFQEGLNSFFGFMPAGFDFEHARQAEGYWDRPFFELFEWGIIEPEEGFFNFRMTDEYVRRAQRYGFHTLANMHSIGHGEHLNIPTFKRFLSRNNASEKPFWITEVQIEDRIDKKTPREYADSLARSYIFALANGAEKLFYVNLRLPEHLPSEAEGGPGFSDLSTLIDLSGQPTPLFYAQRTIALKLANFQKIKKIKEKIRGKIILEGQYRFINDDRVIYVLWGKGRLPSEIKGKVKVADISGSEKILTSGSIRLTSSPIFIEIIE